MLPSEYMIISDPTSKITTGEGVDGYNALFSSRFKKLKQVVSARPEAKLLKSVAAANGEKVRRCVCVRAGN